MSMGHDHAKCEDPKCPECLRVKKVIDEATKNKTERSETMLPCPFCEAAPIFPAIKDVYGTCYDAGCEDCGVATISLQIIDCFDYEGIPSRSDAHNSWDEKEVRYGDNIIAIARAEAIKAWNTRPDAKDTDVKKCGSTDCKLYNKWTSDNCGKMVEGRRVELCQSYRPDAKDTAAECNDHETCDCFAHCQADCVCGAWSGEKAGKIINKLRTELATANKERLQAVARLGLYQTAINQIDDYFEYRMKSKEDQKEVHEILSSLTSSLKE